jgi:hypothetical protein
MVLQSDPKFETKDLIATGPLSPGHGHSISNLGQFSEQGTATVKSQHCTRGQDPAYKGGQIDPTSSCCTAQNFS